MHRTDGAPAAPAASAASVGPAPAPEAVACGPGASERRAGLAAVRRLAAGCPEHLRHARHVSGLALALFDGLRELHGLGAQERFLLECAALVHDIGWVGGRRGHHKTALRIVLETPLLDFGRRERLLVGSVARYHRRALPRKRHRHFAELGREDRRRVRALAAILRVADGLDCSRRSAVRGLDCAVGDRTVTVSCRAPRGAADETRAAAKKADLFEAVFGRRLRLEPGGGGNPPPGNPARCRAAPTPPGVPR